MDLPVDGACIHPPPPKKKTRLRDWLRNMNRVHWKPNYLFEERMFVISSSVTRSFRYDIKVSASKKMPFQPYSTNWLMLSPNESAV